MEAYAIVHGLMAFFNVCYWAIIVSLAVIALLIIYAKLTDLWR